MKKLQFVPYEYCHAWQIVRNPEDDYLFTHEKFYQWAKSNQLNGPGMTCIHKDVIVCSFGIRIFWEGAGEVWAVFCRDIKQYIRVHWHIREYLKGVIEEYGIDRVQARARADYPEAVRYLEWLGFERECLLKKFGPDRKDYYSYVRLR